MAAHRGHWTGGLRGTGVDDGVRGGLEAEKEGAWLHWIYYPPLVAITNEIQCAITYFHHDTRKNVVPWILPAFFLCRQRSSRTELLVAVADFQVLSRLPFIIHQPSRRGDVFIRACQECETARTSWYIITIGWSIVHLASAFGSVRDWKGLKIEIKMLYHDLRNSDANKMFFSFHIAII